jgi:cytochrome c-type biogenesis protein CcmF
VTQIGEVALWIALLLTIWGSAVGFLGGGLRRGDLVLSSERAMHVVFGLVALSAAALIVAFVGDEFRYLYVASGSNRELPLYYKVAGLWGGHAGSLVLWVLLLAFFSSLALHQNRWRNRELMPYVSATLHTVVLFFLVVILFTSNPFEVMSFTPADGRGMNPQLQNYWMTIHPPTLYLGFTAFTIPFAFAVSALLSGRLDTRWITTTRKWTITAWFFLTIGIIFGMIWAYETLGWGGYWFWDPVENASLLPWLTGTAFIHSVMIQEKRGMLKLWNLALIMGTFILTIFATFLTRTGLIESVHSFARHIDLAYIFLAFMSFLVVAAAALLWWRRDRLETDNRFESILSRETAFLANNVLFVAAMFSVMWGTTFPLISEGFLGSVINVGPPFYNRVNIPIGLALLALLGIGPVIGWRKATARNLKRNFSLPLAMGFAVAALLWAGGMRHTYALLTFALGAFTMTTIVVEFYKGTRSRAAIEGEGVAPAFLHLIERNRRRYGGYIVHAGLVIMFAGFAGAAFDVEEQISLRPGESVEVASPYGHAYRLTYQDLSWYTAPNMTKMIASVRVDRGTSALGMMTAERRVYRQREEVTSHVGIRRAWNEDLYLILAGVDDAEGVLRGTNTRPFATFRILVNPLVTWIWFGGAIMALGTLIALWPGAAAGKPATPKPSSGSVAARREPDLVEV